MLFLNRAAELARLNALVRRPEGGLAVIYGRRRVGKTRLLVEWVRAHRGSYFVADQGAALMHRRYFAQALSTVLPGFASVEYPDWRALLSRLAAEARARRFRGPIVLDELPYLVSSSPELPSVLQQWLDHEAREAKLVVALAGSSQRMMQGLVLAPDAPLFGRATQLFEVGPLAARWLPRALPGLAPNEWLTAWSTLGGIPRYWELAAGERGSISHRLDALVLDPAGPLHSEPDRLLLEETPSALELRPLLDAIGSGANRISEIGARMGRPATSLARPIDRLVGLGLVRREVPFGVHARETKRSLYRLAEPFLRLWFRVVAPNRGELAVATPARRRAMLSAALPGLVAATWEELARAAVPRLELRHRFRPAGRWWQGSEPEWDLVSTSEDGRAMLLGEARAWSRPATLPALRAEAHRLNQRQPPPVGQASDAELLRVLFVPRLAPGVPARVDGVHIVTFERMQQLDD